MKVKIWDRIFEVKVTNRDFHLSQDMLIGAFKGISASLEYCEALDEHNDAHAIEVISGIVEKAFNNNIELVDPEDDCIIAEI